MQNISPQMNELIFKESESADFVYFVFKGEVEISKLIENNIREPTLIEK
jgi:CRP-like cAMP-binding protein